MRWIYGESVQIGAEEGGEVTVDESEGVEVAGREMVANEEDELCGEDIEDHCEVG